MEFVRDHRGEPCVSVTCAQCGAEEVVRARHSEGAGPARKKAQNAGWRVTRKAMTCPTCLEKEKTMVSATKAPPAPAKGSPTPAARVLRKAIMEALEDQYDTDAERYLGNASDARIAADCKAPEPLVAKIRCEFFGDGDGNEATDVHLRDLAGFRDALQGAVDAAMAAAAACEDKIAEVDKVLSAAGRR